MTTVLLDVEIQAKKLLAENLRSKFMLVKRLYPAIKNAYQLGHAHDDIYEALQKADVKLSRDLYNNYLFRAKKSFEKDGGIPIFKTHDAIYNPPKNVIAMAELETNSDNTSTHVSTSLQQSVKVGAIDYSKIAMEKLKQSKKDKK